MNDVTNPASFLQDGSPGLLDVRNVGAPGAAIGFDVNIVYPPASRLGFLVQPGPSRPGQPFDQGRPEPVVPAARISDSDKERFHRVLRSINSPAAL